MRIGLSSFVAVLHRGDVLLVRRNAHKQRTYGFSWGFPGGSIEVGESSAQAVLRELREEVGIDASEEDLSLALVDEVLKDYGSWHSIYFFYSLRLEERPSIHLNEESVEAGWFPIASPPEDMFPQNFQVLKNLSE